MDPDTNGQKFEQAPPGNQKTQYGGAQQSPQQPIPPEEMMLRGITELRGYLILVLAILGPLSRKFINLISKIIKTPNGKAPNKKQLFIDGALGVVFLFAVFLIFASIATYTSASLPISTSQRNGLKVFLYYMPLFPKTPEQILIVAIDKNAKIVTATSDFSLSAAITSAEVTLGSLDLTITGPMDFTPSKTFATNLTVKAAASFGGSNFAAAGQMLQKDSVTYFKIDELPDYLLGFLTASDTGSYGSSQISSTEQKQIKQNQQKIFAKWIVYDDNTIHSQAHDTLEENNQSLISDAQTSVQNFFLKTSTLPEVKRAPDETINGDPTYHLTLQPSQKLIRQIMLSYLATQTDQSTYVTDPTQDYSKLANSMSNVSIDLWVSKSDSIVRKISFKSDIDLGFIQDALGANNQTGIPTDLLGLSSIGKAVNPKLTIATVLLADNVNKPVTIDKPSPTVSVDEYIKELTAASETSEQQTVDKKIAAFTKDSLTIRYYLEEYYMQNGQYPQTLAQLGSLAKPNDPIIPKLSTYQYKRSPDGKNFIVYSQLSTTIPDLSYYTPYYGFTEVSQDVHQLLNYEFDDVNNSTSNAGSGSNSGSDL
jgi:hypothetical protein